MSRPSCEINLGDSERHFLKRMTQPTMQHHYVQGGKLILMVAGSKSNDEIVKKCSLSEVVICKWKKRFLEKRLEGLNDLPMPGVHTHNTHEDAPKVINAACGKPDGPYTHCSTRRLAGVPDIKMKKSPLT
jgi:hypothetical protein